MQSRLIVKNFGPIEFVDLNLKNVNVFIGPQASGKSALAKLFTIFKAPRKFLSSSNSTPLDAFKETLNNYNVYSFLKSNSEIIFESKLHSLHYVGGNLSYNPKLQKEIIYLKNLGINFTNNRASIQKTIIKLCDEYIQFENDVEEILNINLNAINNVYDFEEFKQFNQDQFSKMIISIEKIDTYLSTNTAIYIPSERNFIK